MQFTAHTDEDFEAEIHTWGMLLLAGTLYRLVVHFARIELGIYHPMPILQRPWKNPSAYTFACIQILSTFLPTGKVSSYIWKIEPIKKPISEIFLGEKGKR